MALLQNYTILAQYPFRIRGGTFCESRSVWGRGDRGNGVAGEGITDDKASVPSGHRPPSAWTLARKPGGLSAFVGLDVDVSVADATIAAGRNLDGSTTIAFTVPDAALQLVVSAAGEATITFTASGTLAGALSATGSTTVAFTVSTATLGAIVDAVGAATATWSTSATPSAIGHLAGDITPYTELSPQSLASAVWSALSADNNTAATMGRLLNSAGGVSDPDAIAAAVWAAVSRTLTGIADANVKRVNDIEVAGAGTSGDPWGPA